MLSLSFPVGRWDGSSPRSSPGSSTGVLGHFGNGDWAMTPAKRGHVPGSVGPDVLPFLWFHYTVDRWLSSVI